MGHQGRNGRSRRHARLNNRGCGGDATFACGGGKAIQSIESVAQSFRLKKAADPVLVKGRPDAEAAGLLNALGAKLAASAG